MSAKSTDVLFAGVGGQGTVLASAILANLCLQAGHDVKQSEVHGMAQRGGSVTSHVRFGPKVWSPTIPYGEADFLLGFELLEGLRMVDCLAPDGLALVNTQRIDPITVASGAATYPEDAGERIRARCPRAVLIDAFAVAQQAGNAKATNMALLGALSAHLDLGLELWEEGIRGRVPPKTFAVNWAAFCAGRELGAA
ncbi:MAG: indolepyruvate oxidoreductase subunit beta [Candidatus Latescibacterota bacterium]|jgi:indolepyruvate ferredoxin oxidoreductase beta subunit